MATDIGFEFIGIRAAERVDAKADRIDEPTVVFLSISPISHTAHIHGLRRAGEEAFEGFLIVAGEVPEASPVVARTARHESERNPATLFIGYFSPHDAVDDFAKCAVTTKHKKPVISQFHQFARLLNSMIGITGDAIGEGFVPAA